MSVWRVGHPHTTTDHFSVSQFYYDIIFYTLADGSNAARQMLQSLGTFSDGCVVLICRSADPLVLVCSAKLAKASDRAMFEGNNLARFG